MIWTWRQRSLLSFFLILLLLSCSRFLSADDIDESLKFWYRLHITSDIPALLPDREGRLTYLLDLQARFKDSGDHLFEQGIVRTAIGYQVHTRLSVWLGYVWRPTREDDTSNFDYENRIFQQLSWATFYHPHITLDTRTRLEERKNTSCSTWAWRFRQKFTFTFPDTIHSQVTPIITEEVFFNFNHPDWVGNQTFSQNRVFIGVLIPLIEAVTLQLGYLNQYIPDVDRDNLNHIAYWAINISYPERDIVDPYG